MILVVEGKALISALEEFYIFEKIENVLFHVHIKIGDELFRQDNLVALHFFSEVSFIILLLGLRRLNSRPMVKAGQVITVMICLGLVVIELKWILQVCLKC